jgi:hypothetical protein
MLSKTANKATKKRAAIGSLGLNKRAKGTASWLIAVDS